MYFVVDMSNRGGAPAAQRIGEPQERNGTADGETADLIAATIQMEAEEFRSANRRAPG